MPFVSKINVMVKFLQKLAAVCAKSAVIFAQFFGENIFKIISPWSPCFKVKNVSAASQLDTKLICLRLFGFAFLA
jgi:hypothetical protein